jgi:hypothetical protein
MLAGCPGPRGPSAPPIAAHTVEIGRAGAALSGVAGDGTLVFAALTSRPTNGSTTSAATSPTAGTAGASTGAASAVTASAVTASTVAASTVAASTVAASTVAARTVIEALRLPRAAVWRAELAGHGGPLAVSGGLVVAALGGTGTVADLALRGEPGAAAVALRAATGEVAWRLAIDATDWAVITALAPVGDGVVVGGSFAGTMRIAGRVVSSAGASDGFVARLTAAGGIAWLVRLGGPGGDTVQGVATSGDRIALAGTFSAGADLLGLALPSYDERSSRGDGFVAELDGRGARRWAQTFGGKTGEAIAGIAIDAHGQVAVAASVRETVHVGGADHVAHGMADGLVAWWTPSGTASTASLIGGSDFDGLRAITATGNHVVVAGFYSGALRLGDRSLTAAGGDDAFLAQLDASGSVVESWPISGDGREEVTALAAIPGGFIAGVAHTATAQLGGDALAAPSDPMTGAAIVIRPVR